MRVRLHNTRKALRILATVEVSRKITSPEVVDKDKGKEPLAKVVTWRRLSRGS